MMQDLNKNQVILLTLLISFVTSIATGIITTSLLQEAPLEVTRNINSIVEKTIQTVTPGVSTSKEVTTVVVKEEDLIINSINKNIKSIVRVNEKDLNTGAVSLYGIGLVVNKDGLIGADRKTITSSNKYYAVMSDKVELVLTPIGIDKQTNFILFKAALQPEKAQDKSPNYTFVPAVFGDNEPKLGQTLISLGGEVTNAVSVGRVVSLLLKDSSVGTTTVKYLASIETDVSSKDLVDGSPLFNLSGDVVGLKLLDDPLKSFTPISVLKKELSLLIEPSKTQ